MVFYSFTAIKTFYAFNHKDSCCLNNPRRYSNQEWEISCTGNGVAIGGDHRKWGRMNQELGLWRPRQKTSRRTWN